MLDKIIGPLVAFFGAMAALAAIFYRGKAAGKKVEQEKQKDAVIKVAKEVQGVEESVNAMPDDEVDKRMQSYYID